VSAERQKPRLIATDEDLEGGLVALADERNEPVVGLKPEQGRPTVKTDPPGIFQGRDFHPARSTDCDTVAAR
jgi:hypothetical protein